MAHADIQLSRQAGCKKCGTLYNKIRMGLAYCKCNFPELEEKTDDKD